MPSNGPTVLLLREFLIDGLDQDLVLCYLSVKLNPSESKHDVSMSVKFITYEFRLVETWEQALDETLVAEVFLYLLDDLYFLR
jgi:hypothetical protein